jgi:hypothetical protein
MATRQPSRAAADPSRAAPSANTPPTLHLGLTLLEVTEPHLLEDLRRDRRLGALIEGQLSPTVAVVRPGGEEALVQQLRRLGHFPRLLRPAGAP